MNASEAKTHIEKYHIEKVKPGNFLTAVLENNLFGALRYADPDSLDHLAEITRVVWNDIPGNIWGSPEAVKTHLQGE